MPPDVLGEDLEKLWPISYEGQSDTACFDNALELLLSGGYSLPHAMMMLIPGGLGRQPADGRGPARLLRVPCGADGAVGRPGGHRLHRRPADRRHPRPQRPQAGPLSRHPRRPCPARLGNGRARLPGGGSSRSGGCSRARCCSSISRQRRIVSDDELEERSSPSHPYRDWLKRSQVMLRDLPLAARQGRRSDGAADRSPAGLRLYPGGYQAPDAADGPDRPGSGRLDGHRHAHLRLVRPAPSCSTPISSRTSPR